MAALRLVFRDLKAILKSCLVFNASAIIYEDIFLFPFVRICWILLTSSFSSRLWLDIRAALRWCIRFQILRFLSGQRLLRIKLEIIYHLDQSLWVFPVFRLNLFLKILTAIQINGVDRFTVCIFGSFFAIKNIEVFVGLFRVDFVSEIADWICF